MAHSNLAVILIVIGTIVVTTHVVTVIVVFVVGSRRRRVRGVGAVAVSVPPLFLSHPGPPVPGV